MRNSSDCQDGDGLSIIDRTYNKMREKVQKNRKFAKEYSDEDGVEKTYLYLTDNAGYLKVWNLTEIINQTGL